MQIIAILILLSNTPAYAYLSAPILRQCAGTQCFELKGASGETTETLSYYTFNKAEFLLQSKGSSKRLTAESGAYNSETGIVTLHGLTGEWSGLDAVFDSRSHTLGYVKSMN
jgi:hypothetical protein